MPRYCLALDLNNDDESIETYLAHHRAVWPEVLESIFESGIESMEIYRVADRLFMIIEADERFSFERKRELDMSNAKVQEWEALMSRFQRKLPDSGENEKWRRMECIFKLHKAQSDGVLD